MRNTFIRRIKQCLAHATVYILLYFLSVLINEMSLNHDPKGMYLLGWTTHNNYWNVWILSLVLALCGTNTWAWTVTLGNLIGVIVGQILGDYLDQIGYFQTGFHPGFRIWILCVIASIPLGGLAELLSFFKKRSKFKYQTE